MRKERRASPGLLLSATAPLLLWACAARRWEPANPLAPDEAVRCTGTVVRVSDPAAAEVVIGVLPDPECRRLLALGQMELVCEVGAEDAERRDNVSQIIPMLRFGERVEIHGYYVVDHYQGHVHKLRPIVAIDPIPDDRAREPR